jgi:hypothetical protein
MNTETVPNQFRLSCNGAPRRVSLGGERLTKLRNLSDMRTAAEEVAAEDETSRENAVGAIPSEAGVEK